MKKFKQIFSNKGSYILLALALCIIFSSVYVNHTRKKINELSFDTDPYELPVFNVETQQPKQESPAIQPKATKQPESVAVSAPALNETPKEPQKLILPMQGELVVEFSGDKLIFNKTLQDWRVHNGIDIAGSVGDRVVAAGDGTVEFAGKDEMYGYMVIISHDNGLKTIYANLQDGEIVKENQKVKQGEVIGGVGATAMIEIAQTPHLHFAVTDGDNYVNPFDYCKE